LIFGTLLIKKVHSAPEAINNIHLDDFVQFIDNVTVVHVGGRYIVNISDSVMVLYVADKLPQLGCRSCMSIYFVY
jgi:hypothetical protein